VSFDRVADLYDDSRARPDDVREALTDVLAAELAQRAPCLEIGVGTGRIALPLHARGIEMAGADIAEAMLRRLIRNAGGERPMPLMLADATRLPVRDAVFGGVVASYVLHLIPDWRGAVDEAMRALRPGGVLLADFGEGPGQPDVGYRLDGSGGQAEWHPPVREILAGHGISRAFAGVSSPEAAAEYLSGRAAARPLPPVTMTVRRTLRQTIEEIERQLYSWTWPYPRDQVQAAGADLRDWARDHDVPLEAESVTERVLQWWAFERAGLLGGRRGEQAEPGHDLVRGPRLQARLAQQRLVLGAGTFLA
jgi:ubiquinone/menaquinone biosynthesis C-methylase UbiE